MTFTIKLQNTVRFLPPVPELEGGNVDAFIPTLDTVIVGIPAQEKGVRPARALPYELDVHAKVNASNHTVVLKFMNTGGATAVFQVRSGNPDRCCAQLHRRTWQAPFRYVESCFILRSLRLRPERVFAFLCRGHQFDWSRP